MTTTCPHCGAANLLSGTYCGSCGAALTASAWRHPARRWESQRQPMVAASAAIVALKAVPALIFLVVFVLMWTGNWSSRGKPRIRRGGSAVGWVQLEGYGGYQGGPQAVLYYAGTPNSPGRRFDVTPEVAETLRSYLESQRSVPNSPVNPTPYTPDGHIRVPFAMMSGPAAYGRLQYGSPEEGRTAPRAYSVEILPAPPGGNPGWPGPMGPAGGMPGF